MIIQVIGEKMDCLLDNCKFLKKIKVRKWYGSWKLIDSYWCEKLGIELENGYAMNCHSKSCGE